jgi:hypothetical protein
MAPRPPDAYLKAVAKMSNTRKPRAPAARTARPRAKPAAEITYLGAKYKVASKIGIWPQLMLARAAQDGVNLGDVRSLAAVHAMLENVIDPGDWGRFQDDMVTKKTNDLEALLDLVSQAAQVVAARAEKAAANGSAPAEGKQDAAVPGTLEVAGG